ncbi:putative NADH-ubiquinone oxidoreductase 29.9 kDa subunit mitochondrial precursor [Triangularia setosa]|uniref:NADH-ubiquinone oxidoreductase 29.9 kDa subunit mitochondrial n=1 Tax=Triangularia setosa TaxID=2587417 RepID=A0AAN6WI88_9PEZI|nr:putative NADH-ubiquinone oxidoreductase 29.9 kDa subunit mitochondrial precursor [Podospora setosa]
MRATLRLLASVRPTARYLEPGQPTGITGLPTHNAPRSMLLYLYNATLEKLKAVPEHSVYRQSIEAVTKQRLAHVEAVVPPGYKEWAAKAREILKQEPEKFRTTNTATREMLGAAKVERDGQVFVVRQLPSETDMRYQQWDGEVNDGPELEGSRTQEEMEWHVKTQFERAEALEQKEVEWEPEPQLTAEQISELENRIGAGLIEEIIQVAEGELKLTDTMIESKVWEPLEEPAAEGQWVAFERTA